MADCFFHTGIPSVIRCKICGKPLCNKCNIEKNGDVFCSDKCMKSFEGYAERVSEMEAKKARRKSFLPGLIKLIVFLIIVVIALFAAKRFF